MQKKAKKTVAAASRSSYAVRVYVVHLERNSDCKIFDLFVLAEF